jgi:hypothetical protein
MQAAGYGGRVRIDIAADTGMVNFVPSAAEKAT